MWYWWQTWKCQTTITDLKIPNGCLWHAWAITDQPHGRPKAAFNQNASRLSTQLDHCSTITVVSRPQLIYSQLKPISASSERQWNAFQLFTQISLTIVSPEALKAQSDPDRHNSAQFTAFRLFSIFHINYTCEWFFIEFYLHFSAGRNRVFSYYFRKFFSFQLTHSLASSYQTSHARRFIFLIMLLLLWITQHIRESCQKKITHNIRAERLMNLSVNWIMVSN